MLWLTWRQHRSQALVTAGLLAALGTFLLVHGLQTADITARFASNQAALQSILRERFSTVNNVIGWLPLAPALIGMFWGAPVLAREFERGTQRLAWTQSVSVRRWLAVKLGVLSVMVVLAGLTFGGMISAWLTAFDGTRYADKFGRVGMFVLTGMVPAAWWLFAFMAGVAAGAVFRRTLQAIAVTLAVVLAAILSMFFLQVRGYYATPERAVVDPAASIDFASSDSLSSDSLIQRTELIDADGRVLAEEPLFAGCSRSETRCDIPSGARLAFYHHPATRYWQFQWTETAILLAATLTLGAVAVNRTARSRI